MELLEKILIFILFLCPLIFFHELGHFLFARLCGVRVEVFSIGFGPKLLKWTRGACEYTVSLIPLGGYVKMFGDDPTGKEQIAPEDRHMSFTHKSKLARFWIVFGGPLANFLMAYLIFVVLMLGGEKVPEIRLGVIPVNSDLYQSGFRTGDVLKEINGRKIFNPSDIASDEVKEIMVDRTGEGIVSFAHRSSGEEFINSFLKYTPLLRKPIVVDAHGKSFGISLVKDGAITKLSLDQLAEKFGSLDLYLMPDIHSSNTAKDAKFIPIRLNFKSRQQFFSQLNDRGYRSIDLMVKKVNSGSPADQAGIENRDVILALGEYKIFSFSQLRNRLQTMKQKDIALTVWRKGEEVILRLTPEEQLVNGKKVKLIGVYSSVEYVNLKLLNLPSRGLLGSIWGGAERTWSTVVKTIDGYRKLFTAEISFKNVGGPIAIGKVAADCFKTSLSYFFLIMAIISINLGLINLFPIPVLDGGHIMFIILEIINRGPLSRRKLEIAQQFGLSLLLILMLAALFNDVSSLF